MRYIITLEQKCFCQKTLILIYPSKSLHMDLHLKLQVTIIIFTSKLIGNKDENAHRYEVGGKKDKKRNEERKRETERDRETPSET